MLQFISFSISNKSIRLVSRLKTDKKQTFELNFILDIFEKRLKYNQIVYECQDLDVQYYISEFLNQIKSLFHQQLIDQIAFVISTNHETNILRRYLLEFHPIVDQSMNKIHSNANQYLTELDSIFSSCLIELMKQTPASPLNANDENEELRWKLQIRLCQNGNIQENFFEQFQLIDNIQMSLKQFKSVHSHRLNIQLMCQNKK